MRLPKLDSFDIIVIFLTIAMYVVVISLPFRVQSLGDLDFFLETRSLADYIKGYESLANVGITKAPGPVVFYLIPYLFVPFGSTDHAYWVAGVIWTSAFMIFSTLLLRRAGRYMFDDLSGKIACILSLLFPLHLYYTFGITAESLAYMGTIVMLYGWARWRMEGYRTWYRSAGWWSLYAGTVILLLARPNLFLIIPFIGLALVILYFTHRELFPVIFKPGAILIVLLSVFFITVATFVRQFRGTRIQTTQTEYLSYVVHHGRFQYRTETFDWRFWDNGNRADSKDYAMWIESATKLNEQVQLEGKDYNELYRDWVIDDILQHKLLFIKQFIVRSLSGQVMIINSIRPENFKMLGMRGPVAYYGFHLLLNSINILIVLAGILFLARERKRLPEYWVLWTPLLAIILFHASIYMEPRYMFPGRPIMLLMAAYVIGRFYISRKKATAKKEKYER